MTILLNRPYQNYPAGAIAEFSASTESALVAQGLASASTAVVTAGAQSAQAMRGVCAVAAGASSVVVTNPYVDVTSTVVAYVAQTTADSTFTSVLRVVPAAGSFTIFGPTTATAITTVDWVVINNNSTAVTN
jgi:hypothetical protein